jgi:hypothetical protein
MFHVEIPFLGWRKSTYSPKTLNDCVEFTADLPVGVGVRDSKLGDASPILRLPAGQWAAFADSVKGGGFSA